MCTFLMDILDSLHDDWHRFWYHKTMTAQDKSRIIAGIIGSNGVSTSACSSYGPGNVTAMWLAGGAPTDSTLPLGGSIVLANAVKKETFDARMPDLLAFIIPRLEQAREELFYSGIFVEEPLVQVTADERVCQSLVSDRRRHFGLVLGHLFRSDARIEDRRYDHESFAIDLPGIRPDTLEEIAIEVGALFAEPAVLLLDRKRKKSVLLVTK